MPATRGATLSKDDVAEVLSRVPAAQFVDGKFVLYDKLTFGRSPNWAAAKPLAKAVSRMLQRTGGVQALQVPFTAGAEAYFEQHGMQVKKNEAEACAFRLRALVSQLASQKAKGRGIPAAFVESFSVAMDLIVVTPTSPRPATATRAPGQSTVSVSSSDDEGIADSWDRSELFTSTDADLVALLQPQVQVNNPADADADAKKLDAEADTDTKEPDTKDVGTQEADTKEANTKELVPAASPLANTGVKQLLEKSLTPPGSEDWKELQKRKKEEAVEKAKAGKEPRVAKRRPAAAKKRPSAAPPEHGPVEAATQGTEAIGDVAPVDAAAQEQKSDGAAAPATRPDPANISDDEWRKFLNREHSRVYGKQITQMKKTGVSPQKVREAAQAAATAWTDELRNKYRRWDDLRADKVANECKNMMFLLGAWASGGQLDTKYTRSVAEEMDALSNAITIAYSTFESVFPGGPPPESAFDLDAFVGNALDPLVVRFLEVKEVVQNLMQPVEAKKLRRTASDPADTYDRALEQVVQIEDSVE
ncbi:unnamed protein product [Prorocentrum cordatum]|uniref:Uncharacterized protein n=1 Tax=Prorocentrum cordatum TaxID=2364126 RepID=A0ABN9QQX3_9DINO|nr:unnamed protein product [Polarella glacialis]